VTRDTTTASANVLPVRSPVKRLSFVVSNAVNVFGRKLKVAVFPVTDGGEVFSATRGANACPEGL
jgi:hypothetical protein